MVSSPGSASASDIQVKFMGYIINVWKNIPNFKRETEMRDGEKRKT
jgi:hypothetical protein